MRRIRKLLPTVVVLAALAAYLGYARAHNRSLAPPSAGCTLAEFARQLPPPARLAILTGDLGERRIVWIGSEYAAAFPSGPPCYLFDDSCHLVDWSLETGEGGRLDAMATRAWRTEAATLAEVLRSCPP